MQDKAYILCVQVGNNYSLCWGVFKTFEGAYERIMGYVNSNKCILMAPDFIEEPETGTLILRFKSTKRFTPNCQFNIYPIFSVLVQHG